MARRVLSSLAAAPTTQGLDAFYGTGILPLRSVPLSLATDFTPENRLKPSAVMRLAMHHIQLNLSRFLSDQKQNMYCEAQAIQTYATTDDISERIRQEEGRSHHAAGGVTSDLWVQCLGRTSVTFGYALSHESQTLALMKQVFQREQEGELVHISDDERTEIFPPDYNYDSMVLPSLLNVPEERKDEMEDVFQIPLGPQHLNSAGQIDKASLAELALQGLSMRGQTGNHLSIHYDAPVLPNQRVTVQVKQNCAALKHGEETLARAILGD